MHRMQWIMIGLLAVAIALPAEAGNRRRTGTAGAQELRIPISARGLALGDGFVADVAGAEAISYDPAGTADLAGVEVYLAHLTYIADMDKNYASAVAKTSFGSIGAFVDVLSIGDIEETTVDRPEGTGRIYAPNFSVIGVNYSRYLTDAISVGITGKVLSEKILQTSATGVAFDVGLRYRLTSKLRTALILKNFGPGMRFDGADFESFHQTSDDPNANPRNLASRSSTFELPVVFQIAGAYSVVQSGQNTVAGFGSFMGNSFSDDEYQFGAEYAYGADAVQLALRAGIAVTGDTNYNYGPTFGVGLGLPLGSSTHLNIDYGRRTVKDFFDDNQIIAVKFAF